ncbi:metalloregulator ArsR/SmtB family transcription factor [Cereibacter changlensis]|jgi:arsenate reductase|uniref:ArsR family transcriptional regulator n=2 Tax=Cereibacter changlensis TaxID=402884 RepID=A0A2T4JQZ7_9RHOB|nr:metalloregulator ArsR/SmtB family transcription factor [Cereibacter changlensis]MBZ4691075.1 ArsR family transcriptional regulator [Cereibacter sp.]PTE20183.1 ArsR family transcriptional regulator [Cereibacter changlensis JA139]PZX51143.1 ArsR family transcriptional regulator [Cereibacter changlensis]TKA95140.1 metalloregulator ArsR/SmtB family transcription factor [Cereibacter changlensis]
MKNEAAVQLFTALGHPGRLGLFRLLMRHAPQGVRPTEIAATLGVKQNTLSHHLSDLESAGLIRAAREGRSIRYSVALETTAALISYLGHDCGRGRPDLLHPPQESPMTPPFNVLFICSGNSARSIFAEAILNKIGEGRFHAYSAGTRPGSQLNPFAVEVLERNGYDVSGLRSKHLSEFETADAPKMDFVFTVCDTAASEECAPWPGQPMTAHWGLPDPVKAQGTEGEKGLAFARVFGEMHRRITLFAALPIGELEKVALQGQIDRIGDPA